MLKCFVVPEQILIFDLYVIPFRDYVFRHIVNLYSKPAG